MDNSVCCLSHSKSSPVHTLISFATAFQTYFVVPDAKNMQVIDNKDNLPWSAYVGVCGMPGMSAYMPWR